MKRTLLVLLLAVIFGAQSAAASPVIRWSSVDLNRLLFPGQTLRLHLSFQTTQTLSNVSVRIVPALQPILTAFPASFTNVLAGNRYSIDIVATIPTTHPTGVTYTGTVHIISGARTVAQPLSLRFDIEPVAFHPPDASKVIVDSAGAVYPINQLIVVLKASFGADAALAIADSVGGSIVGFAPATNSYELEFPTNSTLQLDAVAATIHNDPRVVTVLRNYIGEFSGATTDIAHLSTCDPNTNNDAAYKTVKAQEAWDFLAVQPASAFTSVTVGVVDTGILRNHPEFLDLLGHPDVTIDPQSAQVFSENDVVGHGTAVSGIIGANNLSESFSLDCLGNHTFQMNGIVDGVTQIKYTLAVVGTKATLEFTPLSGDILSTVSGTAFYSVLTLADFLGYRGIPVVNLSFALRRSFLGLCQACVANFDSLSGQFRATFNKYPNTLFVSSAGDFGGDVADYTPANLGTLSNVVTVGGTDLVDKRLSIQGIESSSGAAIGISAPGLVWAPWIAPLWGTFGGTSASAPMVAGAAGILKAIEGATPSKSLSPSQIKNILIDSADPISTDKPIGPRLNILRAVEQALGPPGLMDDNFNGSSVNTALWFVTIVPAGVGTINETNQQLEMTRITSASSSYQGLASKCKVSGDFDVQVDYKLLNWPAQNFYTVRLATQDLPQGDIGLVGVYRNSYADENYQFRSQVGLAGLVSVSTADTSGTLGLRRTGSTISGYDSHGTIGSASTTQDPTGFVIDFATPSPTAPLNVAIAFDNFKVNSGIVSCP